LAIVNTGGATAEQIVELARYIHLRVLNDFGVLLQPEPILVGLSL
ncbi:MAG: UDP-N-acetylenolpyruvoylglucosamine reductase, partial [Cryobacterium sp.]|nr:UDP-N-acetylenolpyruvoylglucosamine reductase [Cryobacterium sp.]